MQDIQTIAGEPGLDILRALDPVHRRRDCDCALADEPAQQGAAHHQCTAHGAKTQFFQARFAQCNYKHIPMPPQPVYCSENNLFRVRAGYDDLKCPPPLWRRGAIFGFAKGPLREGAVCGADWRSLIRCSSPPRPFP